MAKKLANPIKKNMAKKTKWQLFLDHNLDGPVYRFIGDRDGITELIHSANILGPIIYVFVYTLTTIVAPIPTPAIGVAGGFVFGWWGILWSLVGALLGFYLVFIIARRWGQPFVEKVVKKDTLEKFNNLLSRRDGMLVFALFLLPVFPDSVLGYLAAGLTKLPIRNLMIMAVLGRLPGLVVSNYIGSSIDTGEYWRVAIITGVFAVVAFIFYINRGKIESFLNLKKKS